MCEIQCVCSFQCISVRTSHASMAGEAHVARGYPVGQRRPRLCTARGSDADILSRSLQRTMEWTRFPLSSTADLTKHLHRRYLFFWYSSEHCWCCALSAPFHRIGNWGSDMLRDLSKTAHLEKGWASSLPPLSAHRSPWHRDQARSEPSGVCGEQHLEKVRGGRLERWVPKFPGRNYL